jgi:hypothetical protein
MRRGNTISTGRFDAEHCISFTTTLREKGPQSQPAKDHQQSQTLLNKYASVWRGPSLPSPLSNILEDFTEEAAPTTATAMTSCWTRAPPTTTCCRTTRRRPRQPAAGPRDGNRDDELMDAADHYCLLLDSVTAMTT